MGQLLVRAKLTVPELPQLPNKNPLSNENIEKMRLWLRTCDANHMDCALSSDASSPPGRLIHIGHSDETIRLVAGTTKAKYAALSYCWGKEKTSAPTTKANVANRQSDFRVINCHRRYRMQYALPVQLGLNTSGLTQYASFKMTCLTGSKSQRKWVVFTSTHT